ncbi:MAG TPA: branched-chain amino acid ABC transporter permease [Acidisoma sp.]|nr:branched-chain amino acid ABC transporter permease [Acidisoma sp.]
MIALSLRPLGRAFTGPHDLGRTPKAWGVMTVISIGFLAYPAFATAFDATNVAFYLLNIPMALGLSLLWGYGGVLSFGQVAFFAVSGYVYGIVAGNFPDSAWATWLASLAGLGATVALAAGFGYFIFYARVAAWIVPILTLVLALLLSTFLGLTAGPQWTIGQVALGGYNGMTGIPALQIGGLTFQDYTFYYLVVLVVIALLIGLRTWVNSQRGQVLMAIREDAVRTELLGYDVRREQLRVFVGAAVLSGISGLLYVQWGNYITPSVTSLSQAALPVIWVAVAGRDSLIAVAIMTFLLNLLSYELSSAGNQYALVIIGVLLVAVMLFAPEGVILRLARLWPSRAQRLGDTS